MAMWDSAFESEQTTVGIPAGTSNGEVRAFLHKAFQDLGWPCQEDRALFTSTTPIGLKRIAGEQVTVQICNGQIIITSKGRSSNASFGGIKRLNTENIMAIRSRLDMYFNAPDVFDMQKVINDLRSNFQMHMMGVLNDREFTDAKAKTMATIGRAKGSNKAIDILLLITPLIKDGAITESDLAKLKQVLFELPKTIDPIGGSK